MIENACQHHDTKKHGRDRHGVQRYKCLLCGKTFSEPKTKLIGDSRLPVDRAVMCLRMLLEGVSIRAVSRLTGTDKNAIIALAVEIGQRCDRFMKNTHRDLQVDDVQCDEMWGFVNCKERTRERLDRSPEFGDCYCFTAIERNSKLLIAWHAGKRSADDTERFIYKLKDAVSGKLQISTDGYGPYRGAIQCAFGWDASHGVVIKNYGSAVAGEGRYSPAQVVSCEKRSHWNQPDMDRACTSHVECCNLSMRMGMRRLTRLTNGHSKKRENHEAALGLWFAYYNYCRVHETLKSTPAVAAGLADHTWTVLELLERIATH